MTLREVLAAVADGYAAARDAVIGVGTKILDTDLVSILTAIGWLFLGLVALIAFIGLLALWHVKIRPHLPVFQSLWFIAGRTFARFLKVFKAR